LQDLRDINDRIFLDKTRPIVAKQSSLYLTVKKKYAWS